MAIKTYPQNSIYDNIIYFLFRFLYNINKRKLSQLNKKVFVCFFVLCSFNEKENKNNNKNSSTPNASTFGDVISMQPDKMQ